MSNKFAVDKERTFIGKCFNFFLKKVVSPIARMVWLKEVEGEKKLPQDGTFVVAANHQSFLDFILLFSVLSDIELTFLAAEKFYTSKLTRFVMRYSGQIKVDRKNKSKSSREEVLEKGVAALNSGRVLVIFPQGTRSRSGKIEKTFTGVAKFAVIAGVPIVPVGIRGAYQVWPSHFKKPKFEKKISLHFGNPVIIKKTQNIDSDYKMKKFYRKTTNKLMGRIGRLSGKDYFPEN